MLIIDLLGVSSITLGEDVYSWGLLDSNQVIYLNNTKELRTLLKEQKPIVRSFKLNNHNVTLTNWIIKKKAGCAIPQDQMLAVAKLLIADAERNYINFLEAQKQITVSLNRKWFFGQKNAWFEFLFYMLYQDWKGHYEREDEETKEELKILDGIWERETNFEALLKWINKEKTLVLRCVGDKYHLTEKDLEKLKVNEKVNLLIASQNEHDSNAIGVYLSNGKQLGFIRRSVAKILHDRINFEDYQASINWLNKENPPNNRILIKVTFKKPHANNKPLKI